jgi:hypothetical protein
LSESARLVFEEAEANVAIVTKYSAHRIGFVIVIYYKSRCTLFNMDATDSARIVLLLEYRLAILARLMNNATIVTATSIAILTYSICSSSIFAE